MSNSKIIKEIMYSVCINYHPQSRLKTTRFERLCGSPLANHAVLLLAFLGGYHMGAVSQITDLDSAPTVHLYLLSAKGIISHIYWLVN
ncbi:MAG: hypothetical protein ACI4DY_12420, partial [Monoglobaceae bacterium]